MSDVEMDPIRWGILSTALINTKVLRGAALTASAEIRAVASRTSRAATQFAREWGIPVSYGTYDALLEDPAIEAVYIPLPNGLHHEWTMRALHAGKHVLCEKPYSRHPTEVIEAFDLAEENGLVLSEAYMYRYNPQILRLTDLVASGEIGELRMINSSFTWPTDAPGDVRLDPTLDGGSLLDVGCYCVNAARLLAGEPTTANAQWKIGPTGVEVQMVGTLRFESDVMLHFDSGFHLPDRSALEVVGTIGTVRVNDPWHCLEPRLDIVPQVGQPRSETTQLANSYQLELEEFAAAVRSRPSILLGRRDAVGQARTLAALIEAAASERAVAIR